MSEFEASGLVICGLWIGWSVASATVSLRSLARSFERMADMVERGRRQ